MSKPSHSNEHCAALARPCAPGDAGERPCYWLMKSEPDECSIDDALARPGQVVAWTGVRNYQARNFMRDSMRIGDGVLFYHSGCTVPGVAGLAEVASSPYPDPTQFDAGSPYFDPKSRPDSPRWLLVDVRALRKTRLLSLAEMRARSSLEAMPLLRRGNRLSITPVASAHWHEILDLLGLDSTDRKGPPNHSGRVATRCRRRGEFEPGSENA